MEKMDHLDILENRSIHILREAYSQLGNLCMLWSIGKDSTVLLWLARKAFFGHVPFPLVHIDTHHKIPEMIEYRDKYAMKWNLDMIYGENPEALASKNTYPDGKCSRMECCRLLKTEALSHTLSGEWPRWRINHATGVYDVDANTEPYTGVIVGVRADEEGSRSKERYFSPRDRNNDWDVGNQPPEFWNQYKTDFAKGTHVRVHPLLDWTELDIWEYIERERIPMVSLYFNQGEGVRYRSLGCKPCTNSVQSEASTVSEIVEELRTGKFSNIAERSGRAQDKEDGGGLETLRREGYM
ncbi:MAG: sulfate adenylyltransferase subunit 2 [Zoogloeaceae bacterium]|jgi:sulfate adenylyltransferase subunit 2|nr:sulfate adenylyltransferase subunit 2 [Zoogloeaceae bacterium]